MAKRIAILGSTGSIGTSALSVVRDLRSQFAVVGLAAGSRGEELARQAAEFAPEWVALVDPGGNASLAAALAGKPTAVLSGAAGVREGLRRSRPDLVLVAVVGAAGLDPALAAADLGADLALANKECLVMAGPLLKERVRAGGGRIIPVDSEHSAIFQVLQGQRAEAISRIVLTASGGPCRDLAAAELETVTPAVVL